MAELRIKYKPDSSVDSREFNRNLNDYLEKEAVHLGELPGLEDFYIKDGVGIVVTHYLLLPRDLVGRDPDSIELISDSAPIHGLYERIVQIARESGKSKLV